MLNMLLLVLAFVFFVLAAINVPMKFNAVGAGLAFLTLSFLIR